MVMFAWGNPSRGDDAVGPWFAERFRHHGGQGFTLVEDFQLQVEHLLDCREGELLLFVDARCADGDDDYRLEAIAAQPGLCHTSHALSPAELLGCYPRVFPAEQAPPAFLLTVPGRCFELGEEMSTATLGCCRRAAQLVEKLLAHPDRQSWHALAGEASHA